MPELIPAEPGSPECDAEAHVHDTKMDEIGKLICGLLPEHEGPHYDPADHIEWAFKMGMGHA